MFLSKFNTASLLIMHRSGFIFVMMFWLLGACVPPSQPSSNNTGQNTPATQAIEVLDAAAREFQELSRPSKLKVWGEKLNFRAWPGVEAPILLSLSKDEQMKYLYQRTIRQESHSYGNQSYLDSWLLVKAHDQVGWVHGGGVVGVPSGLTELFNPDNTATPDASKRMRSDEPSFTAPVGAFNDKYLVIPGKQVGDIILTTSEDQLLRQYGADVSRGKVEKLPGEFEDCTILFENEKDEIRITWKKEDPNKVKAIYIERAGGHWHLKRGVYVGQAISDVSKLNGAPVKFYGLGGRYGGVTESFSNGRFQPILRHGYLVMGTKGSAPKELQGDQVFISSQKEVAERDVRVTRMVVYLD